MESLWTERRFLKCGVFRSLSDPSPDQRVLDEDQLVGDCSKVCIQSRISECDGDTDAKGLAEEDENIIFTSH